MAVGCWDFKRSNIPFGRGSAGRIDPSLASKPIRTSTRRIAWIVPSLLTAELRQTFTGRVAPGDYLDFASFSISQGFDFFNVRRQEGDPP